MAIKVDFSNIEVKPPTWSGTCKCHKCGSKNAFSCGGRDKDNKFCYKFYCFDCKHSESENSK